MLRITSVLMLAGLAGSAFAKTNGPVPLDLHKPADQVAVQMKTIQQDLGDGETYSEISPDQRSQVREALGRIQGKLERNGSVSTIPERDQAEIFNDQELVNTILTKAKEDSRLVCRRERATGSNRLTSNCMTVAERRRLKEQGQKAMMDLSQRGLQYDPRAGGGGN
ncbi:MAG TPA: hypothetical protein DDZ67_10660 [Xanthomonadaceae bacterium]|nr:hypothetical protein [Xanthomonadaceae bacterium]